MSSQVRRPFVSADLVCHLAKKLYNFEEIVELMELSSYSDRNFYIRGKRSDSSSRTDPGEIQDGLEASVCSGRQDQYVFKVLNSADSKDSDFVDAENSAITFLRGRGFPCPVLIPVFNSSELKVFVQIPLLNDNINYKDVKDNNVLQVETEGCIARLMSFLPGVTASTIHAFTGKQLFCIGQFVGSVNKTLQEFACPSSCQRSDRWSMENLLSLTHYVTSVQGEDYQTLVREVLGSFSKHVTSKFPLLRRGTIHNDIGTENLLIETTEGTFKVSGLVDFGDMRYSFVLLELATTLASFMREDNISLDSGHILAGYQSIFPLPGLELDLLYHFVAARLCQVFLITSEHMTSHENQTNEYLVKLLVKYRTLLKAWWSCSKDDVVAVWRSVGSSIET